MKAIACSECSVDGCNIDVKIEELYKFAYNTRHKTRFSPDFRKTNITTKDCIMYE